MASGTEIRRASTWATSISSIVAGSRLARRSFTSKLLEYARPRSKSVTTPPMYFTYCSRKGRSRPSDSSTAATASGFDA